MNKITVDELREKLNYNDTRAIRSWCKRNNVLVIKHGKMEFVIESNFEEAYEKPFINKLKGQFGSEWESVYRLYKEGNVPALNMLQEAPSVTYKAYKSNSTTKSRFQEKLDAYKKNSAA
ncbi:MAG: hypothetical protein V4608_09875 [Bacteroidota bacterium]